MDLEDDPLTQVSSFIEGDIIHNDITSTGTQQETEIELYSETHNSYMNSYDGYSPLQKIFVMLAT